ncbi:MAG TPA: hypothetical protein VJL90_12905 [Pseudorhodoplanes sp.]|nr:hypothetical protein [Pseudorhodoplanes sp.]
MLTNAIRCSAVAGLFMLAFASHAQAQGWSGSTSCVATRGMANCVTNFRDVTRDPHVRHVRGHDGYHYSEEADERARKESLARDRKWLAFCKPVVVKDRYGAERYLYDKPGCEFGRSE